MFLLGVGELLEEMDIKSVGDTARSMSLNVRRSGKKVDRTEVYLCTAFRIFTATDDELTVHMGTVIPAG